MSATASPRIIRAIEEAFLTVLRARHPELEWETIEESDATPLDEDAIADRGSFAA